MKGLYRAVKFIRGTKSIFAIQVKKIEDTLYKETGINI